MRQNIFKICLLLSLASITWAAETTQVSASILDGFADDINIQPYVEIGNKLYHFGQNKVSWYKAYLNCRSLGGYLASFNSAEELTAISNYLKSKYSTDDRWWLSATDLDSEGDFYWHHTGERVSYADWSTGQPDNADGHENCVHLWYQKTKYEMNDWICKRTAKYICETDKPKTIVVSVF